MSYYKDMLFAKRQRLADAVELVNNLLEELESEIEKAKENGVEAYRLKKSVDRVKLISTLRDEIVDYDTKVLQYVNYYPEATPYYKEKLEIARRYVKSLGGDWSTVTWGKLSDYQY